MLVIPKGVDHKSIREEECCVMLLSRKKQSTQEMLGEVLQIRSWSGYENISGRCKRCGGVAGSRNCRIRIDWSLIQI